VITNPTPQRALRSHHPQRPRPQVLHSPEHQARLARHLTARDRWLLQMLFEHHVLTTDQITELAFPSRRYTNARLRLLYQWGVVHRFQPHRTFGSYPMHYVLDTAGALVLAHELGTDLKALGYDRMREIGRAHSLQLAHTVGCNGLFTALVHCARQSDSTARLTAWWSPTRCAVLWGDIVTPDGYGRWRDDDREVEWFLEFDFGTEKLSRLAAKLPRYAKLAATTGIITPVLFWFASPQRETNARRVLADAVCGLDFPEQVPVGTTSGGHAVDISDPRWQALDNPDRAGLAGLGQLWPDLPALERPSGTLPASAPFPAPDPMPPGGDQ
jgi:hypothetical protein